MKKFEIDGEIFSITKITNTINPNCGKYTSAYRDEKNSRTATLIVEKTVEKVKDQFKKASKKRKIYSKL